jgi:hypothetical protein
VKLRCAPSLVCTALLDVTDPSRPPLSAQGSGPGWERTPLRPREAGHYIPQAASGEGFAQSNDVFVDKRRFIYLIDRVRGLDILRFTGLRERAEGSR